jgi:hypothetical protein
MSPVIINGILVVSADSHTNSKGGLMAPYVRKLSGNVEKANDVQRLLWRGWKKSWKYIANIKAELDLPVISVFNGDTVDKNKHDPWDAMCQNPTEILNMAVKALEPALDVSDSYYFTKGTEAHTGPHSWFEDELAKDLGCPQNGSGYAHPSLLLDVGGQIFDIRHHTESNSIRTWTKGAGAMRSAKLVQDYYLDSNDKPPDWALRNHVHHFEDSGRNRKPRALFLPCWQAPGSWIHRIGIGAKMPEFGLAYFVCKDGKAQKWDVVEVPVKRSRPMKPELMI